MLKRTLILVLIATPAMAQQSPPTPSQQMVGQLATALAQAQDRVAELQAALKAQLAKTEPAQPAPK